MTELIINAYRKSEPMANKESLIKISIAMAKTFKSFQHSIDRLSIYCAITPTIIYPWCTFELRAQPVLRGYQSSQLSQGECQPPWHILSNIDERFSPFGQKTINMTFLPDLPIGIREIFSRLDSLLTAFRKINKWIESIFILQGDIKNPSRRHQSRLRISGSSAALMRKRSLCQEWWVFYDTKI